MIKTRVDDSIWLVQQHHHALVSGFLGAHWGGKNGFARPGHFPGATVPARWRDEVILGIAEHDNGWWEWEAMPSISARDGLPIGIGEAATPTPTNEFTEWRSGGFDRWRLGINRLAKHHPYAALLTSLHAYWLYAVAFDDLLSADSDARRHFVFGAPEVAAGLVEDVRATREFLDEMLALQRELKETLVGLFNVDMKLPVRWEAGATVYAKPSPTAQIDHQHANTRVVRKIFPNSILVSTEYLGRVDVERLWLSDHKPGLPDHDRRPNVLGFVNAADDNKWLLMNELDGSGNDLVGYHPPAVLPLSDGTGSLLNGEFAFMKNFC